jgi:glyoxylase-like metal-dependent hydrolase (beta-lactamase superfamily II)
MPSLTLGPWSVHTLETGTLRLDGGSMFGSVPKPIWSRSHPADDRNRILLAARALLLEGQGRRVLVDIGVGDKFPPKLADIYAVDHAEHTLERSLAALGLGVGDITDLVLTHLHFDHAGGATRLQNGVLVPRLPRAQVHVQRRNLENARRPNPRERASYFAENWEPLEQAGLLRVWDGAQRPWPGIELFTADGHTRGQQLARVSGPEGTLYYVADLIPTASHVRIPFVMGYDVAAIETMDEKRRLLEKAVKENAWIFLEHDPEIALARPVTEADDFGWSERVPSDNAASPVSASDAS